MEEITGSFEEALEESCKILNVKGKLIPSTLDQINLSEMKDGTLVLNVLHGKELEIEYEKKNIMDKINSFFGYNCINQITLKKKQQILKHSKAIKK